MSRFGKYASPRFKFESVGDTIAGTLVSVREAVGQSGDEFPVLTIGTTYGEREVWASQYQLKELLSSREPSDGDHIEIKLTGFEPTAMGKMKLFDLKVSNGTTVGNSRQATTDEAPF